MFSGHLDGGLLPYDIFPTPKNTYFLSLLVSDIYRILPMYCATILSFLETSVRNSFGKLIIHSWLELGMFSLNGNLNPLKIETTVPDLKKKSTFRY